MDINEDLNDAKTKSNFTGCQIILSLKILFNFQPFHEIMANQKTNQPTDGQDWVHKEVTLPTLETSAVYAVVLGFIHEPCIEKCFINRRNIPSYSLLTSIYTFTYNLH